MLAEVAQCHNPRWPDKWPHGKRKKNGKTPRTGSVKIEKGGFHARIVYVDQEGLSRQMKRRAPNRRQAEKLLTTLCEGLRKQGVVDPKGSILVVKSSIWARATYIGSDGKRKQKKRRAESKTHAKELIDSLLDELKEHGAESLQADRMTFSHYSGEIQGKRACARCLC